MKPKRFDPLIKKAIWHSHKTSELDNDEGFIKDETDPIYSADKPDIALKSELHDPVTVEDTDSIDLTLTGQQVKADFKQTFKVDSAKNSDTVNNLEVKTAVPEGAVFTDTTYTAGDGINITAENEIQNTDKGSDFVESDPVWTNEKDRYKSYAGFVNRTDSEIRMNGDFFEIEPVGTDYTIYTTGKKHIVEALQTVEITDDQTITYVYFDNTGTLQKSTTAWDLAEGHNIPTVIIFKDGSNYALTDERHSYERNKAWHRWAHFNLGAMYKSGLTGVFTTTSLSVAQGIIYDEDIRFDTEGTKTATSLWYRNGTNGMRLIRNSAVAKATVGGVLAYDNGSGTLQEVTNNSYTTNWVYCSNDATEPIYTVVGQNNSNTIALARNATPPVINLSTAEWKIIYRVIYRRTSGTPTGAFIEAEDFRAVQTGSPTSPTSFEHSSLTGRDALNSHPISAITDLQDTLNGKLNLDQTVPQTILNDTPKLDVLKSKTILGTDIDGKIIEGTHQDISGKENSLGSPLVDDYVLSSKTDGTRSWVEMGGGGGVGGDDTEVQYNDEGALAGDSTLTFNKTTKLLTAQHVGLPTCESETTGVINVGGNPFLHSFSHPTGSTNKPVGFNVMLGHDVGNFTMGETATNVNQSSKNVMIGYDIATTATLQQKCVFIGDNVAPASANSNSSVIIGTSCGVKFSNIQSCVFIGRNCGGSTGTASAGSQSNVGIGRDVLSNLTTGQNNVGIGNGAGASMTSGGSNVAIGQSALINMTTRDGHTAVGFEALRSVTTGLYSTAVGRACLRGDTGNYNTAVGWNCFYGKTTGNYNVVMGYGAGGFTTSRSNIAQNTIVGAEAGENLATNASGNVLLGYRAGNAETGSNKLYISNSNTTTPLIYGEFSGATAGVLIYSQNTAGVPLRVRGIASQSGNLQEWQDNLGNVLASVDATGVLDSVGYEVGGVPGIDKTITVLDADGSTTHELVFTKGILTACTTT